MIKSVQQKRFLIIAVLLVLTKKIETKKATIDYILFYSIMEVQQIHPEATVVLEARGELVDEVNLKYIFSAAYWGNVVQTISIETNKTLVFVANIPTIILSDLKRHPIVLEYHNVSWNIYLIREFDEPVMLNSDEDDEPVTMNIDDDDTNIDEYDDLMKEAAVWNNLIGDEPTSTNPSIIIPPTKLNQSCCLSAPSFNPMSSPFTDALYNNVEWGIMTIDPNW